jgi:quercetin dioxygenase-like cupin family protein
MDDQVIVNLPPPHTDDRGSIQMLIDAPINSVLVISSEKGSLRANHYHKQDAHYCYLAVGRMEYYYRPAGRTEPPAMVIIEPGQLFYTPPMVEHAMKFLEDSIFYAFAKLHRDQDNYESDVVRVTLV